MRHEQIAFLSFANDGRAAPLVQQEVERRFRRADAPVTSFTARLPDRLAQLIGVLEVASGRKEGGPDSRAQFQSTRAHPAARPSPCPRRPT
jgi:hypothetical protein